MEPVAKRQVGSTTVVVGVIGVEGGLATTKEYEEPMQPPLL